MAQRSGVMESCVYGSCIHYWIGTFINTSRLFFRLAWSNPWARQEKFYDKTDSNGHIFQKWNTIPWYQKMHQNFVMKILNYGWETAGEHTQGADRSAWATRGSLPLLEWPVGFILRFGCQWISTFNRNLQTLYYLFKSHAEVWTSSSPHVFFC